MATHDHDVPASTCCHGAKSATRVSGHGKDPVCAMQVDPATAKFSTEHGGQTFYFCGAGCRSKFIDDPGRYLDPDRKPKPEKQDKNAIYLCPMHPEVRQIGPRILPEMRHGA